MHGWRRGSREGALAALPAAAPRTNARPDRARACRLAGSRKVLWSALKFRVQLQRAVSMNKRRFIQAGGGGAGRLDLDLTYICDRLIAMAIPCVEGAVYRNDIRDVRATPPHPPPAATRPPSARRPPAAPMHAALCGLVLCPRPGGLESRLRAPRPCSRGLPPTGIQSSVMPSSTPSVISRFVAPSHSTVLPAPILGGESVSSVPTKTESAVLFHFMVSSRIVQRLSAAQKWIFPVTNRQ
jgi:hypothetical protein